MVSVTLPRNLTPQQQLDALNRAQRQAEQRVRLGMQLFKSAEARLGAGQELVHQLRAEQDELKAEMKQQIEQDLLNIKEHVTERTDSVEQRLEALSLKLQQAQEQWQGSQQRVGEMMARCEAMLEQGRHLMLRASQLQQAPPGSQPPASATNHKPDTTPHHAHPPTSKARDMATEPALEPPEPVKSSEPQDPEPLQSRLPPKERSEQTRQMLTRLAISLQEAQEATQSDDASEIEMTKPTSPQPVESAKKNPVFSRVIDQLRESA